MGNPVNSCTFVGRLTKDPQLQTKQNGQNQTQWVTFTIAVDRSLTKDQRDAIKANPNGHGIETTDFIQAIAYGNTAKLIADYFVKGKPILINGELRTWKKDDGNGNTTYGSNIRVDSIAFLPKDNTGNAGGGGNSNSGGGNKGSNQTNNKGNNKPADNADFEVPDDDIPF